MSCGKARQRQRERAEWAAEEQRLQLRQHQREERARQRDEDFFRSLQLRSPTAAGQPSGEGGGRERDGAGSSAGNQAVERAEAFQLEQSANAPRYGASGRGVRVGMSKQSHLFKQLSRSKINTFISGPVDRVSSLLMSPHPQM